MLEIILKADFPLMATFNPLSVNVYGAASTYEPLLVLRRHELWVNNVQ